MFPFKRKEASPLSEELLERIWDLSGRLKQLESNLDERLNELAARYRRAEQSERRLDEKRSSSPCADDAPTPRVHPALRSRSERLLRVNNLSKDQE